MYQAFNEPPPKDWQPQRGDQVYVQLGNGVRRTFCTGIIKAVQGKFVSVEHGAGERTPVGIDDVRPVQKVKQ